MRPDPFRLYTWPILESTTIGACFFGSDKIARSLFRFTMFSSVGLLTSSF